ncbi:MAG: type I methionyl aminopeptidase [Planctomycetota bacterium]
MRPSRRLLRSPRPPRSKSTRQRPQAVQLKSPEQVERMRDAGRVVFNVHEHLRGWIKPGMTTLEIDEEAYRVFTDAGAVGLFKNYPTYKPGEGFPSHCCISVNEVVVHGIADDRVIKEGDIVGVDCGVKFNGWCGDSAYTHLIGEVSPAVRTLCDDTQHVLQIAIDNIKPGRRWSQIARLMQRYAESHGYGVVKDFVGHGIGSSMHEEPKVPNFVSRDLLANDILLREGLVLAIEPMCNLGTRDVKTLKDGWTVVTTDGQPAAHYEHTVAVTSNGADVLTDGR